MCCLISSYDCNKYNLFVISRLWPLLLHYAKNTLGVMMQFDSISVHFTLFAFSHSCNVNYSHNVNVFWQMSSSVEDLL